MHVSSACHGAAPRGLWWADAYHTNHTWLWRAALALSCSGGMHCTHVRLYHNFTLCDTLCTIMQASYSPTLRLNKHHTRDNAWKHHTRDNAWKHHTRDNAWKHHTRDNADKQWHALSIWHGIHYMAGVARSLVAWHGMAWHDSLLHF